MLLTIAKTAELPTSVDDAWALLRRPERVAACVPNIREFMPSGAEARYTTVLVERLGPFSVAVALTVDVTEEDDARRMVARFTGEDRGGQARVRGEVAASLRESERGSVLDVASDVEVLGRLAAVGAVPIRRRGDQMFGEFVRNLAAALEDDGG
jgi:carbon monoxide dehydrogenase subunit G